MDRNAIQRVAVVKLDGEGAEAAALKGLQRRLPSANAPAVIFEFVDWAETRIAGQAAGDAQAFLLQLGYRLFRLADDGKPSAAIE